MTVDQRLAAAVQRLDAALLKRWRGDENALSEVKDCAAIANDVQWMHVDDTLSGKALDDYLDAGFLKHFLSFLDWDCAQEERVFVRFAYRDAILGWVGMQVEFCRHLLAEIDADPSTYEATVTEYLCLNLAAAWEGIVLFDELDDAAIPSVVLPRVGGIANADRYRDLRAIALNLYRDRTWPSARAAAKEIWQAVYAHSLEKGPRLSEDRAQQTVYEWLLRENTRAGSRIRDRERG